MKEKGAFSGYHPFINFLYFSFVFIFTMFFMHPVCLDVVESKIKAGMSTEEINTIVYEETLKRGGTPAPLGYQGYPKSTCTSINEVICHGIPSKNHIFKKMAI